MGRGGTNTILHASRPNCRVLRETEKAIQVEFGDKTTGWVPKSCVHDDSELWSLKNPGPGKLVVVGWFAEKNNWPLD